MFSFGDDASPAPDSVNVMEEIVIEFVQQLASIQPLNLHRKMFHI